MKQKIEGDYVLRIMKYLHLLIMVCLFYVFFLKFRNLPVTFWGGVGFRYNYYAALFYGFVLYTFLRTYNSYSVGFYRVRDLFFAQFLSLLFSVILIYIAISIAWNQWQNPAPLLMMLAIQAILSIVWTVLINTLFFNIRPKLKTALVYKTMEDYNRVDFVNDYPHSRQFEVIKVIKAPNNFDSIIGNLSDIDVVIVSGLNSELRNELAKYCVTNNIQGFFVPHVGDVLMQGAWHEKSFSDPALCLTRKKLKPEYAAIKRVFDIVASFCGILVLSPIMILTAIAIKVCDGGPVFYSHIRLTKDGREFRIYKFRSMCVEAERNGIAQLAKEHDNRITPVGRVIRSCRIDELPQLFNILKGDMTFVGPRPERPEIAEMYTNSIPAFPLRLQVKAGLTGYAQIYGKYNTDPYEKLEFDLMYINNMNVLVDLQLIFATISVLFKKESTEGFKNGTNSDIKAENYGKLD